MKIGLNLLLWTGTVTEEHFSLIGKIKEWGYDGVEIPFFDLTPRNYIALGNYLDDIELERTAVTVCTDEENPIGQTRELRQAGLDRIKRAVDCCTAAGATHLVGPIHSAIGVFTGAGPTADEWKWGKEILGQAAEYASENNVILVFEPLNRFECYFANCVADAARFCREVNHPHLKMMFDTFHANIEEKDFTQAIHDCADQMGHVHISESDRSTPGEGNVPWDETFRALKEVNYDGWLTIEAFGLALPEIAAATKIWRRMFPNEEYLARKGLEFIKKNWENA